MLCLMELWFDCVSIGVYFESYTKMEQRTKSLDVPRVCTIPGFHSRDNTPAPIK